MVIIIIILEQMKIIPFTNTKYIKNKYSIKMFSLHILIKAKMVFFGNDQCHNISSYKMPYYIKTPPKIISKSKYSNVVQKYWQIAIKDNLKSH